MTSRQKIQALFSGPLGGALKVVLTDGAREIFAAMRRRRAAQTPPPVLATPKQPAPLVDHTHDPKRWLAPGVESPGPSFVGETMKWEIVDDVLEVELMREPCNEIGLQTLAELEKLAALAHSGIGGARALLFYSSRPAGFSAGADLRSLYEGLVERRSSGVSEQERVADVRDFVERIHAAINALDIAPVPVIAATHGVVFGGGFELALIADMIVADKSTRFCFPELRLGLVPGFGGIPRLERDLGNAVVRDLLMSGRSINAKRAQELGLVSQLVARGKAPFVARRVAQQAIRFDARTVALAKPFIKPLPIARLEREKDLFCEMIASPVVEAALKRFVESTDVMPYLPSASKA